MSAELERLQRQTFARATKVTVDAYPAEYRHPWLSLTVTEGDRDRHVVVLIEGPAEIISPGEVPADVAAAATGDWIGCWLRLDTASVLSYAAPAAAAGGEAGSA